MATKTQTVKVMLKHKASYPGVNWVEPIEWEPNTDWANDDWKYESGAFWSDTEDEAGLAVSGNLDAENNEGDIIEVSISEVHWRSSGDCRYLQDAEIAAE